MVIKNGYVPYWNEYRKKLLRDAYFFGQALENAWGDMTQSPRGPFEGGYGGVGGRKGGDSESPLVLWQKNLTEI